MKKILVVIPTYNEMGNIEKLLTADFDIMPNIAILVVDDNSPDGTGNFVDDLISKGQYKDKLFVIHREGKLGLGTAYITGFMWGLAHGFDILISQDADFSHDPKYLPQMVNEVENGNSLVIGSRYVNGGGVVNWGLGRKLISRGGSLYARILLLTSIRDLTGGYNCYSRQVLDSINLASIMSNGYCFQVEMKWRCKLANHKVKEIPIIFEDRRVGQSKMSKKIFIEAMFNVLIMAINRSGIKKSLFQNSR